MFGFLNVNKPAGPTSHDIVAQVRRILPRKTKVGHAGTLDPFADGVLVICVGKATRLASYVQASPKRYLAGITLGATSTTDDPEGQITRIAQADAPPEAAITATAKKFVGEIEQVPPAHSAVHVAGVRAYKLARAGEQVTPATRTVTIHAVDVVRYEYPLLEIDVTCGSGTYIRALARDIGRVLGVGGYCSKLTRLAVGQFMIDDAISPDDSEALRNLHPPLTALGSLPKVQVNSDDEKLISAGRAIEIAPLPDAAEVAVLNDRGELVAIGAIGTDGLFQPRKVFR